MLFKTDFRVSRIAIDAQAVFLENIYIMHKMLKQMESDLREIFVWILQDQE